MTIFFQECVGPRDFANVLSVISSAEALQRGAALWEECCMWMQATAEKQNVWGHDMLLKHLQDGCVFFLTCPEHELPSSK